MLIDFRQRGQAGERKGEKHRLVASHTHPDQGQTQAWALTGN